MSKHHIKNLAEQLARKGYASAPFHNEKNSNLASEAEELADDQKKVDEECDSIKLRAYQIHQEKGGSDLDNWLEAERYISHHPL